MKWLWTRLSALPAGVYAALTAAIAIFVLYLRGRRLEAELGATKLQLESARAHAQMNRSRVAASRHMQRAQALDAELSTLELSRQLLLKSAEEDRAELAALPPSKIYDRYVELAERRFKKRQEEDSRP